MSRKNVINQFESCFSKQTLQWLLDDRAWWPLAFYDRTCKCRGNFYGLDCSSCKHGYMGKDCDQKSKVLVRKSLTKLTIGEIRVRDFFIALQTYLNFHIFLIEKFHTVIMS